MSDGPPIQPTLWRTCRVLANRTRLRMLAYVFENPNQSVSSIAKHLNLPLPVASQYLRALEARSLLASRRLGRLVKYRLGSPPPESSLHHLVSSLRAAFRQRPVPIEMLYKTATACTHPRRIEILRSLHGAAQSVEQIRTTTRISARALVRHLHKLKSRGCVNERQGIYLLTSPPDQFGRALAQLAAR